MDFYRQHEFFEKYRNFHYLTVGSADFERAIQAQTEIYKQSLAANKTFSLVTLKTWAEDVEYITADTGAVEYLRSVIPELNDIELLPIVYFIVPKGLEGNNRINEDMKDIWGSYYKGSYDFDIFTYSQTTRVISIGNSGKVESSLTKNPIIILNNMGEESLALYWNIGYIFNSTMYDVTDRELSELISDVGFTDEIHYKTNVYEQYIFQWEVVRGALLAGLVILSLLLVLEIIMIRVILYFEYTVNSLEMSLRKILGYNFFEKYKKLLLMSGLGWFISLSSAFAICVINDLAPGLFVLLGGAGIALIEICVTVWYINKLERIHSNVVLKGARI